MLELIKEKGDDSSNELITLLLSRNLYKRIFTIHESIPKEYRALSSLYEDIIQSDIDKFTTKLRNELLELFLSNTGVNSLGLSTISENDVSIVEEILKKPYSILVDIPFTKRGSPSELCIIPELEGLKRNDQAKLLASNAMSIVWKEVYTKIMSSISKIRIYCHPNIKEILTSVLGYNDLTDAIRRSLNK